MNDWWKAPVLQGPENDYGDYDYLIEKIPKNSMKWELSKETWKCDDCGKYSHLTLTATDYFRTLDGYDSTSWTTCWRCFMKEKLVDHKHRIVNAILRKVYILTTAIELHKSNPEFGWKQSYDIAKMTVR